MTEYVRLPSGHKTPRFTKERFYIERFLYPERVTGRPKTRGDCADVVRPCPYVGCRFNLFLEVTRSGAITYNHPTLEPWDIPPNQSCALDMAEQEQEGMTLEDVGKTFGFSRERTRQIETVALRRMLEQGVKLR